jgi:3-phosphoshikimate 1-carboxyvinyltransferase
VTWKVIPSGPLAGEIEVPGDKSITHRAYILGSVAMGPTVVARPLRAEDTDSTLLAVKELGVEVDDQGTRVVIGGKGPENLLEPGDVLDLGNSGTGVRLLAGLLAGCPFLSILTGDASLRRRPMARVATPLRSMGAAVDGRRDGDLLPLAIRGGDLTGIEYLSPVSSAQVKSCVLLAGLQASGTTVFSEPSLSRDHTERMLHSMGVELVEDRGKLVLEGGQVPTGCEIQIPGDISSAAFFMVAASIIRGSDIMIRNVGINPTRTGILRLLEAMEADIEIQERPVGTEPAADIGVRGSETLRGIEVPIEWVPSIIDELPLAAVAAATARGQTIIRGAGELRVKESDRIRTTVGMLQSGGVEVEELDDGFVIHGGKSVRGARFTSGGDHRIAMAASVLSLVAESPCEVAETACVSTSFRGFPETMNLLSPGSITEITLGTV